MAKDRGEKKKEAQFANTPFRGLKLAQPKPPPPAKPAARPAAPAPGADAESELFAQAMSGVERLVDPRGAAPPPPPPRAPVVIDDDAEAFARLSELVSGEGAFDISDTDEFIEGTAPGVDRRLLLGLKRGDYAWQAHLDLHGMTRAEAKEAADAFLTESRRLGRRCVLIVHGRGLNSKDQIPVLKEQLRVWLQHGRLAKAVLAFATARPHDGGAGALYVLLRR